MIVYKKTEPGCSSWLQGECEMGNAGKEATSNLLLKES